MSRRARALVDRLPAALLVLVAVGVALRIALDLSYRPAVLTFADSIAYIAMANETMFSDPARTAGYSVFLDVVHTVSDSLTATIQLQHLLGIATALVIYGAVRRLGAPLWAALVGAGAVLLCLDQIYLEHAIASEGVFTFLLAASLYCAVRSLEDGDPLFKSLTTRELWLLGAGLLLGSASWVRGAGAPLIPFLALWVLLAIPGRWYTRVARAGIAAGPALALLLVYFALNSAATGTFGLLQSSGWGIYSRTAQFADCSKFTPPEGTEELCETIPSDERPGPDFYSWSEDSPAQREFGGPPGSDEKLGEFGWSVVRAQPFEYVRTLANDFTRYFFPRLNAGRPFADAGYDVFRITTRNPVIEEDVRVNWVGGFFEPVDPVEVTGFAGTLEDLQSLLRVHPLYLFQAVVLACLGVVFARGRVRAGILLLGGAGVLLLAVAATNTYNARYAIPINGPLLAAGALGLWVLLERYRARRSAASSANASA